MRNKFIVFIALILAFSAFSTVVSASTSNTLSTTVTVRDKDFSADVDAAPRLRIKSQDYVSDGGMFLLSLSETAKWTYDDANLSLYFDRGGNDYVSKDTLSNQAGFTYTLKAISDRQFQVTLNAELDEDNYMYIPLIVKIDGVSEASVSVSSGESSGVSSGTYIFANQGMVNDFSIDASGTGKNDGNFIVGDVILVVSAGMGDGEIELTLPSGFVFDEQNNAKIELAGEGSYSSAKKSRVSYNSSKTAMYVRFEGTSNSTSSGRLYIRKVWVNALDNASEGDIIMNVSAFGIRNEKFKFGEFARPAEPPKEEEKPAEKPKQENILITVSVTSGNNTVMINGEALELAVAPFNNEAGRMMVPLRFISQAFGISENNIAWDEVNKVVTIVSATTYSKDEIVFTIGSNEYLVNKNPKTMDTTAVIKDGYTFIPVRYVADALGLSIGYNPETKTVAFAGYPKQ